jgi:RNA ligase
MNVALLKEMIDQGFIHVQKHDNAALYIYNYSAKAQYEACWNEVTLACRGLILDEHYNCVARPFPKFFNMEEVEDIIPWHETYEIVEKMDGSLGILYWIENKPYIATRGSFNSEQALKATTLLYEKYAASFPYLNKTKTYLFEIIYPENRIVVNYGEREELVLLAIIDSVSGAETGLADIGFPLPRRLSNQSVMELKQHQKENEEGYVLKFHSGYRIKMKFDEYVRLHKILTQISSLSIWEFLKDNST